MFQSFGLLDKKSIKVNGIKDFSWSPTDNILAYWIAEDKDVPAKVTLVSIPSREEVGIPILSCLTHDLLIRAISFNSLVCRIIGNSF